MALVADAAAMRFAAFRRALRVFRDRWYNGWKKWLIDIALILLVFIAVRAYQQQGVISGQAIPVNGQLLDQTVIDWQAYRGKPMLLHFWATWCPVCRLEEDSIQSIAKDYSVLTIASWSDDTAEYMHEQSLNFPTLEDNNGSWAQRYGVKAVPTSFILNADGGIEFVETGYSSEWGLRLRLWWLQI